MLSIFNSWLDIGQEVGRLSVNFFKQQYKLCIVASALVEIVLFHLVYFLLILIIQYNFSKIWALFHPVA